MLYCSQEKATIALLFSGNETVAILFSGERNWCSTVLRRRELVHYCSQEKGTVALLFSGN